MKSNVLRKCSVLSVTQTSEAVSEITDRSRTCEVFTGASSAFFICKIEWHRFILFDNTLVMM